MTLRSRLVDFKSYFASVEPIKNIADPLVFRRKFMEATNRPMTMPRS